MNDNINEVQARRAENIIWNFAQDYSVKIDYKAYSADGKADIYWNSIIGACHRYYDYSKIKDVFIAFQQYEEADIYEAVLWLGIENAVSQRLEDERPVIKSLREKYAENFIRNIKIKNDIYDQLDRLSYYHYAKYAGCKIEPDEYTRGLLNQIEFPKQITTDEIIEAAKSIFEKWFFISTEYKNRNHRSLLFKKKINKKNNGKFHRFGLGFTEHPIMKYGESTANDINNDKQLSRLSETELRQFMEVKYGKSLLSYDQIARLEKEICTGNHRNCHILITKGERQLGKIQNGFESLQREKEAKQIEKNRHFFLTHISENRTYISKITSEINNLKHLFSEAEDIISDSGNLISAKTWRTSLDDQRIFSKNQKNSLGMLSVDILIDASTSQKYRQEIVSSQGYIIAESLCRCEIPCRVMSFCSMTGFTILKIFRDYTDTSITNKKIFDYVSNGCNRDGLALSAAHKMIAQNNYENRLLIIISDSKPVDVVKVFYSGEYKPYEKNIAVNDTAQEVRRAISDNISVVCVFTGEDEDITSAKLIYGNGFRRVKSLNNLSDAVIYLLKNQMSNL